MCRAFPNPESAHLHWPQHTPISVEPHHSSLQCASVPTLMRCHPEERATKDLRLLLNFVVPDDFRIADHNSIQHKARAPRAVIHDGSPETKLP